MSVSTPLRPFGRKQPTTPLPDSKTIYEPLLKRELASRLFVISAPSFVFTWLASIAFTLDFQKGPPLGIFGHTVATILLALCGLLVGTTPPLILRGHTVSASYVPQPTRADTFFALISSTRTWRTLAYFILSGFSLTLLYVAFINVTEWDDSRLSVLAPTRRNAFRLNERFFYLAFFNSSLGLVFATRDLIRARWAVKWYSKYEKQDTITTKPSVLETIMAALNHKALFSTALITLIHVLLFPFFYRQCRIVTLPLLRNLPGLSWFTRPLLHGFARTWTVDVSWFRMLALGFKTSLGWELIESAFDYWSAKPIAVSLKASDPNVALITGLHSKDCYFKHHAYLELSALASSRTPADSARRAALFVDTKTTPTLWNALLREILLTLGHDYQRLLRRGKPAPPPPAPSSTPKTPKKPSSPSTPLIRQPILKPSSPSTLLDSFASDGAATNVLTTVASLPEAVSIPSVFLPSSPSTPVIEKTKPVVKVVETKASPIVQLAQQMKAGRKAVVASLLSWVESKLPKEWEARGWWTDVSVEQKARACLPEGSLDVAAVEALSHLVAASLSEDSLGIVQRDIPRVLEAMLSFLSEAETYQAELEAQLPPARPSSEGRVAEEGALKAAKEVACAVEVVIPVIIALRTSVGLIAKTFGERLGVYKFPPVTAKRLQSFMDYL